MLRRALVFASVLAGCHEASPERVLVAEVEGLADPRTGRLEITVVTPAGLSPLLVVQDGVPGSGPPGSVELHTTRVGVGLAGCGADQVFCGDVTVRSFYGVGLRGVYVELTSIVPVTGHAVLNSDPPPPGLAGGLGGFAYGDLAAPPGLSAASREWRFENLTNSPFTFRGRVVGERRDGGDCRVDADCASGACLLTTTGGRCGSPCGDSSSCAADEACTLLPLADGTVAAACQPAGAGGRRLGVPCATDADCAENLCHDGLCSELCGLCAGADEARCEATALDRFAPGFSADVCRMRPTHPIADLGPFVTDEFGRLETQVAIPPNTAGFVISLEDFDYLGTVFTRLIAPSGARLIDLFDGAADANRARHDFGSTSVLVPGNNNVTVQTGNYRVSPAIFDPDTLLLAPGDLETIPVVVESRGQEGGTLDLNLHFAPGTGITAATAPASAYVANVVTNLDALLRSRFGVRVGLIRYADVPAVHDRVDDVTEMDQMCGDFAFGGPRGASLNVFVVVRAFAAGVAGGVPGPPGCTCRSVANCVVAGRTGSASVMSVVLGHEIGHYLGLFHTSELTLTTFDQITDTPQCPPTTQEPLHVNCPDAPNLMFPRLNTTSPPVVSSFQARVVRNHPMLHELRRPGLCPGPTFDVTEGGFGTGNLAGLTNTIVGSCGGAGPDRAHLYQLRTPGLSRLVVEATGVGFTPIVHVRAGSCAGAEQACASGSVAIASPTPGDYFVFVDTSGAGGDFTLSVREEP